MLNKEDILALAWEHSEGSGKRYTFTEESLFEFLKELKTEPAPAQDEQNPIWGYAGTIGNLIAQLRTLDPDMEIYSPHRLDDGRIVLDGLTLSKEWKEGRWLRKGDDAKRVAVLWTQPDARPAQTEQQPVAVPKAWWQLIHDTLRNYRMGTLDDGYGGGYPLIDAMTADGQPVSGGIEECTYLADAIWNALYAAPIAQTAQETNKI